MYLVLSFRTLARDAAAVAVAAPHTAATAADATSPVAVREVVRRCRSTPGTTQHVDTQIANYTNCRSTASCVVGSSPARL